MGNKRLVGLFILLGLALAAFGQEEIAHGKQYMQDQEYAKAYKIFSACAEIDTSNHLCTEQAGMAAYRMGSMKKAKDHFHKIENEIEYFKSAAIHLANIYEQEEHIPRAIKYNIRLRDSFPENALYHRKLGGLLMKANLPLEAFPEYAAALKLNPDDITTIKGVAELFILNNQLKEADSLLRVGLAIDNSNIGLNYLFARNFYKAKEYDSSAMVLWNLRGRVDFPNYYSKMLGYSLLQIDSVDKAIFYLEKSLVNEGDPEYAHYYLGNAYELKEDNKSAIFHFDKAIDAGISKGTDLYYRNKARLLNDENNLGEAIKAYEWSYRLKPDPVLLFYLGRASDKYYKDKNIAIRYYQQYIKSIHDEKSYKDYARQRIRYLKEKRHQETARK
jgi:tetratricopeptide (TPR) repeat protein